MNTTQNISLNKELTKMKTDKRNKIFLGLFLAFALITLACKLIDGILLDLGLRDGTLHPGFWTDPNWIPAKTDSAYHSSLSSELRHPNTFWFLTQFTWITTIMIILFISVRLFMYSGGTPKWLRWVMTQRTLSWVATFDIIVGVLFWSSMFKGFSSSFNQDLKAFEITYTIFVHAIIPILITVYAFIYLIKDKKASLLRTKFIWKGMIYISVYISLYLILTIVWNDPYPITNMHEGLVNGGWGKWASELWKLPVILFAIYTILGCMFITHNFVLVKFNKKYDHERDYEAGLIKKAEIEKYQKQVRNDIIKAMKK